MEILQSQFQKQWEHHSSCKQWALQKDAKARVICLMQEAEEHSYFSTEDQFLPDELQEDWTAPTFTQSDENSYASKILSPQSKFANK